MQDIVIEINRGMVTSVYTDVPDARVVVVDWDLREREPPNGVVGMVDMPCSLASLSDEVRTQYNRLVTESG